MLIDAWGERYLELSRGNLKQKHWKEVADIVSSREHFGKTPKTDIQCKNRIDTVKKKYKSEKAKIGSGCGPSKWPFYERLDQLIGPSAAKIHSGSGGGGGGSAGTSSALVSPAFVPKGVPMGIPVGVRSLPFYKQQQQKRQIRKRVPVDSESSQSEREPTPDSTDSFPPETYEPIPKRPRYLQPHREMNLRPVAQLGWKGKEKERDRNYNGNANANVNVNVNASANANSDWGNSVRELTRAILKFGEAYEHAETSKLQQLVEMEKQRMKFAKELELQRMQFFMKTQLEISQLKRRRDGGGNTSNNHHHDNNNINNSNNSDSSN